MTSLPSRMTAIAIRAPGRHEVLVPEERPVANAGSGEVLVRLTAAGVNRPDVMQRLGSYPPPPGASDIPGLDIAGEVAAVGPGATRFKPGDRVVGGGLTGAFAEQVQRPETQLRPLPDGADYATASAFTAAYLTAYVALVRRAEIKRGEWLLVHGALTKLWGV